MARQAPCTISWFELDMKTGHATLEREEIVVNHYDAAHRYYSRYVSDDFLGMTGDNGSGHAARTFRQRDFEDGDTSNVRIWKSYQSLSAKTAHLGHDLSAVALYTRVKQDVLERLQLAIDASEAHIEAHRNTIRDLRADIEQFRDLTRRPLLDERVYLARENLFIDANKFKRRYTTGSGYDDGYDGTLTETDVQEALAVVDDILAGNGYDHDVPVEGTALDHLLQAVVDHDLRTYLRPVQP